MARRGGGKLVALALGSAMALLLGGQQLVAAGSDGGALTLASARRVAAIVFEQLPTPAAERPTPPVGRPTPPVGRPTPPVGRPTPSPTPASGGAAHIGFSIGPIVGARSTAAVSARHAPPVWQTGETKTFAVEVSNTGTLILPHDGPDPVELHAFFLTGPLTPSPGQNWTQQRNVALPRDLLPGESETLNVTLQAPPQLCCQQLGVQLLQRGKGAVSGAATAAIQMVRP